MLIDKISPKAEYTLKEIFEMEIFPGMRSIYQLYNLVTEVVPNEENATGKSRILRRETTANGMRAVDSSGGWNNISGKIKVSGEDILKFYKLKGRSDLLTK